MLFNVKRVLSTTSWLNMWNGIMNIGWAWCLSLSSLFTFMIVFIHVLTNEHPKLRFSLGVMCIMCVVEWINDCSCSSLQYLERPYCECHCWFRCWLLCVRQWPRSRTFLNSRRNFPVWKFIFNDNPIVTTFSLLTWHEIVNQWIDRTVCIAEPMGQKGQNRHQITLIVLGWISVNIQCMHWEIANGKHYHYSYQHFWSFSSRFQLSNGCWIRFPMTELLDFICGLRWNDESGKVQKNLNNYFLCNKLFSSHDQESCWSAKEL